MIKLLSLFLQFGIPLVDLIWKRSSKKAELKEKMFELVKKYDQQILENAKLRKEYLKMKKELLDRKN